MICDVLVTCIARWDGCITPVLHVGMVVLHLYCTSGWLYYTCIPRWDGWRVLMIGGWQVSCKGSGRGVREAKHLSGACGSECFIFMRWLTGAFEKKKALRIIALKEQNPNLVGLCLAC